MHLIDTHCHINMMVKKTFDQPLSPHELHLAASIIDEAHQQQVKSIINVGTSLIESKNCHQLGLRYPNCYTAIGIHPNDCTQTWRADVAELKKMAARHHEDKIVAIGECGIDKHYPDYNLQRQYDAFRAQIELALEYNLALIVHSRDAADETLSCLDEYRKQGLRGVIHCFSENLAFAQDAINMGFVLGLGGTITYPKNEILRTVAKTVPLEKIILETDAPFLPPQPMRGKQNHPQYISYIAHYLADLRGMSVEDLGATVYNTTCTLFNHAF